MKNLLTLFAFFFIVSTSNLFAQIDETCGTFPPPREYIDLSQQGGIYLTSRDELKVLIVFVRFKDDSSYHPHWPVGQPPNNYNSFIDSTLLQNSTHYNNLTNYFKKMSLGIFKVTGKSIYVETPHNKADYGSPWPNRYLANKDVLQNVVDPIIDFNEYDNWSSSSNYNHLNQPDGTIDHIIMIWRGLVFADWWSGEASLGYGNPFTVENGTKTIKTGFGLNSGSGVTVHYWGLRSPERNFKVTVHETSHWLLGGSHPYNTWGDYDNGKLIWGMLTGGNEGICANVYERERLAWINPTPITGDILNAPFHDYVEYGTAYKYHPPNGETNEYYYFANHQKLSIYDNATSNPNDKGIFVLHQRNIYNETNNIRIKTSNGQWNWSNPFNTNCWGNNLPAFKPSTVNRAGLNNRDRLPKSGGGTEWLFALINDNNQAVCGDWLHGWGLNNSFNLSYNDVFSPYSNPYTHTWSNSQNNFTMEVFDQNGSILNAKFYITNPLNGKPSKPQDLRVTVHNTGDNAYPKLNWELNLEPDVISSSQAYLIERSLNGGAFTQIATANGSTSQYIDYSVWWAGSGPITAAYKIRAKDTQGLTSLYSDTKSIQYGNVWKENLSDSEEVITEYRLQQNYPNPFNPVTNILYQIPKSGLVQLKVYDLLGSEIAVLVNEIKSEGSYTVSFDASNLPSGVYIYSLRVNDLVQNNKMTLLK